MLILNYTNFVISVLFSTPAVSALVLLFTNYLSFLKTPVFRYLRDNKKNKPQKATAAYPVTVLCLQSAWVVFFMYLKPCTFFLYGYSQEGRVVLLALFMFNAFSAFVVFYMDYLISTKHLTMNYSQYIPPAVFSCFLFLYACPSLLHLFLNLEVVAYIFYFQFMQPRKSTANAYDKAPVLNSVLLYFWGNFLGSVCITLGIYYLLVLCNSVVFSELILLLDKGARAGAPLVLVTVGMLIKSGAIGAQFLKVEVYKGLKLDAVLNFSFVSTLFYVYVFLILVSTVLLYNVFVYVVVAAVFFVVGSIFIYSEFFKVDNLVSFFGYSTVITTSLMFFAIIC